MGAASPPFTVEFPHALPLERDGDQWGAELGGRRLRLSNLDKVFWPDEGYTKGDLLAYYFNVADLILPYLRGRPLTMKRMPDGAEGKFFFEKSAPSHTPDWIQRCPIRSDDPKDKVIDYLMVRNAAGLLFVANLGCIEFHPLHSRCAAIATPDYFFFDLDPMHGATFDDVLIVARHVRTALDNLGLTGFPKTSGATGMQIYVPIEPRYSYPQVRELVGNVGRLIVKADPDHATMKPRIADRGDRVFIDHNMNREGANISAVYCLRPEPGATVSTPLTWDEVEAGLTPQEFRIDNVFERFATTGDLFAGMLNEPQDIGAALEALDVTAEPPRGTAAASRTSSEVIASSKDPGLATYLEMRDFDATPEPAPSGATGHGNSFVIQKHRASRLHYDVRLEHAGALPSWAIPKGLPIEKGDKRLAVRTEDHPLEYGSFEGTIPDGHYGAGEVRIFDAGTYERVEWDDKKVSFVLHGRRYPGLEYHLVKTKLGKPGEDNWLVFLASKQDAPLIPPPPAFTPMLAEGGHRGFDDPRWRFEPKLDGIRALAILSTGETKLLTRNGRDVTDQYPELHMVHELVNQVNAVLDAEIVAFDEEGKNSFEALQQRMNLSNEREIKRASTRIPVALVAFDLLFLDGHDVTGLPLEDRRELLEAVVEEDKRLQLAVFVEGSGIGFTEQAKELQLEGVMAKKLGSRYLPGKRSPDWRKIKLTNTQDCVILGWTPGQGGRTGTFGALLVGAYVGDELRWVGQVGTGFTDAMLEAIQDTLESIEVPEPPGDDQDLAHVRGARFVEPKLVCEVEYLEMTSSTGKMRAPSFKGLRTDKTPEECVLEA
ncbi:MAG: non-homologous end-joining DNA ligase [Actinomycetota bacterium]